MPPCVNQVTVEAYGYSSPYQCYIPLSGAAGTTATVCSNTYCLSVHGGGNYARSTLKINTGTVIYTANQCNVRSWANTASNVAPTVKTQGVSAGGGYSPYNTEALIGDVGYYGGKNGRKYLVNCYPGSGGKCPSPGGCGIVFGGLGGQAGPYGPGGNGSNPYPNGDYRVTTRYSPGAGGGANGGTSAVLGTPGVSRWGTPFSGGGGLPITTTANFFVTCNLGTVDPTVNLNSSYGPVSGGGGAISCAYGPSSYVLRGCGVANSGIVVITGYQNAPIPSGAYRYVFTICSLLAGQYSVNAVNNINGSSVYSMCIPIGTTSTEVRVLGGGSAGNACNGVIGYTTSTSYPSAGGGGGGYARSTYTATVTATGVTLQVWVSHSYPLNVTSGYNNSSTVTINGVLEARAYSGYAARGGGCGGWGANYARNGITYTGGWGGQGYYLTTTRKGGGGGGAAWEGGRGGYGANAQSGTTRGPGGGGAARCTAAGCNGSIGNTTQGGRGGNSGGVAGTGGSTGTVALGGSGLNGGGGAGGGYASLVSTGGAGGTFALFTATNTYALNINLPIQTIGSLGPGGGGGGTYGGSSYTVSGGCGALYGGGGGGGGTAVSGVNGPGQGTNGLVAVTFIVCGTLSARYMNTASSSVSQSIIID